MRRPIQIQILGLHPGARSSFQHQPCAGGSALRSWRGGAGDCTSSAHNKVFDPGIDEEEAELVLNEVGALVRAHVDRPLSMREGEFQAGGVLDSVVSCKWLNRLSYHPSYPSSGSIIRVGRIPPGLFNLSQTNAEHSSQYVATGLQYSLFPPPISNIAVLEANLFPQNWLSNTPIF